MSIEKYEQAAEAYNKYGSQQKAADALGIPRRTFRNHYNKFLQLENSTPVGFKTTKVSTDGSGKVTARTHKLAPEITDDETREEGQIVRRSTLYGADGNVTGEWVIRKPVPVEEKFADEILETFKAEIPRSPMVLKSGPMEDKLAVFNIVDDHVNMRAHKSETGEDWDIDKCLQLYIDKFTQLVDKTDKSTHCLMVNIGDQFHANDHMAVTPASKHSLDVDIPFADAAKYVIQLNRARVQILNEKFGTVTYHGVRGNHDEDAMVMLFEAMKIAYENDPAVKIGYSPSGEFVTQYGSNMLCFDHGDKGKPDMVAGNFANSAPEIYGSTKHRYIHTGHVHHDQMKDTWGGFLWRSHRTLSARDKYTAKNKYHSPRSIKSYIYDKEHGEETIRIVNV